MRPGLEGTGLPTDRRFTGQRREAGLGLYDYGARYYDPTLGRFIQADTLVPEPANPQSLNRYSYVLNSPLRYTDPTGHAEWPGEDGDETIEARQFRESLMKAYTDPKYKWQILKLDF